VKSGFDIINSSWKPYYTTRLKRWHPEFIYNFSKFVRAVVKIDRSSEDVSILSELKDPVFKEEKLFLKLLIEGKANLYVYEDVNLNRYFYNVQDSKITQLIYKSYKRDGNRIGVNNSFKRQLLDHLKCSAFTLKKIKNLTYKQNSLISFFKESIFCAY
jgi:hypothetical protein